MKKTYSLLLMIFIFLITTFKVFSYNTDPADDRIFPGGYYLDTEGTNTINKNEQLKGFVFRYDSEDDNIRYLISWDSANVKNGLLEVRVKHNGENWIYPIYQGGLNYRFKYKEEDEYFPFPFSNIKSYEKFDEDKIWSAYDFSKKSDIEFYPESDKPSIHNFNYRDIDGDGKIDEVWVRYKENYITEEDEEVYLIKEYRFSIKGKTLIINISGGKDKTIYPDIERLKADNNYSGTDIGRSLNINNARTWTIPYTELTPAVMVNNKYFYSIYTELNQSEGSRIQVKNQFASRPIYINIMGIPIQIGNLIIPNSLQVYNTSWYTPNTAEEI
ncbi:MAG: hypothetical protein PHV06_00115, partial [bacterium]|nr:hypothetical protein [bacterium]